MAQGPSSELYITDGSSDGPFRGPAPQWIDEVTSLAVGPGFDTFILWADGPDQLARFAEEIVPAVRERVQAERGATEPKAMGDPG